MELSKEILQNIRMIAMDLDGTLTQHKTPMDAAHTAVLDGLREKYTLLSVGAGQVLRIFAQMNHYPLDIIGNYGMQTGLYNNDTKSIDIVRDTVVPCDKEAVTATINAFRKRFGWEEYAGETVEFHPSGCVTFPILGTRAVQSDKLAFDPDRTKRRAHYKEVCEAFPDFHVFVGGSSSYDMAPKPFNKYYALDLYCRERGIEHGEVVYIGDDYGLGGNDESIFLSDFPYLKIDSYQDFATVTSCL